MNNLVNFPLTGTVAESHAFVIFRCRQFFYIYYYIVLTCYDFSALMEPDHISKRYKRSTAENESRKKREAPYTIYPEILVIVDYDGYRLHGGDNLQVKRYFVSFWNGVDLRYKLLKGPKVRISIAGIIISRVSNTLKFYSE